MGGRVNMRHCPSALIRWNLDCPDSPSSSNRPIARHHSIVPRYSTRSSLHGLHACLVHARAFHDECRLVQVPHVVAIRVELLGDVCLDRLLRAVQQIIRLVEDLLLGQVLDRVHPLAEPGSKKLVPSHDPAPQSELRR